MQTKIEFDPLLGPGSAILGHLGFRSFMPHPLLQAWVQCYWVARQTCIPEEGFTENLYPDGGTNINFRFFSDQLPEASFQAFQVLKKVQFNENINLLGVRFRPGGAFQLLGVDIPNVIGSAYQLDELDKNANNSAIYFLREKLYATSSINQRINLIDDWLLQQMVKQLAQTGPIQHVLSVLPNSANSIDDMSSQVGLSRRQLERRFQQEVGMTLVHVKQLQRMKKARQLISSNPNRSLTDIAHELGFYDQSHFIHQFQKINQQSPGEYRDRKQKS